MSARPASSKITRQLATSIEIAQSIVWSHGSVFIKGLLRSKRRIEPSIKIGGTKEEVLENLIAAIEANRITREYLDVRVQAVEGGGVSTCICIRHPRSLQTT